MLQVNNIDVSYGDVQVLFDVSLDIKAGELVAVIGANGAGKTGGGSVENELVGLRRLVGSGYQLIDQRHAELVSRKPFRRGEDR